MLRVLALLATFFSWSGAAADPVEVDVELLLMVDVSRSMSPMELEIQRRGYAAAIRSPEVMEAVQAGLLGRVAISYVEWAGTGMQKIVVDWGVLATPDDAEAFSSRLLASFTPGMRRTSLSDAIRYGMDALDRNDFAGLRRVMDVSGDGPNNSGGPVLDARDAALSRGIIINGLPLMTHDGIYSRWDIEDLDRYYVNCVIGGLGAFAIPVTDWTQFAEAVRRKLVLELAGGPVAGPLRVQAARPEAPYDCEVGEKIWDRNLRNDAMP